MLELFVSQLGLFNVCLNHELIIETVYRSSCEEVAFKSILGKAQAEGVSLCRSS